MKNIIEIVNVSSESDNNGGRQMMEKRMSLPRTITVTSMDLVSVGREDTDPSFPFKNPG